MRNFIFLSMMIVIILFQTSCQSTKDIKMFQTAKDSHRGVYVHTKQKVHNIKPFDNLYIKISTLDPEVNQVFNRGSNASGYSEGTFQMYNNPTSRYINGYIVSEDSTVNLPILGDIKMVGLTLKQAQEQILTQAKVYLVDPSVEVKFLNYKINVIGEVRTPNVYYNYEGKVNILDAISMANGITDFADLKNVEVKRFELNKIATYKVDLTDNSIFSSDVFFLQPDDLVYIPPSKLKRQRENSDLYSRMLSTISTLLVAVALMLSYK